ncbi:PREDICTED: uncharacterized protein LOC106818491, partial [Priapulus caudatus]|uniref:Uncharacterized protein LOC106818491 n=1 Tax=Priapulus caudatus TaxID=37621 RepID=A0ABM1F2K4_PRICU
MTCTMVDLQEKFGDPQVKRPRLDSSSEASEGLLAHSQSLDGLHASLQSGSPSSQPDHTGGSSSHSSPRNHGDTTTVQLCNLTANGTDSSLASMACTSSDAAYSTTDSWVMSHCPTTSTSAHQSHSHIKSEPVVDHNSESPFGNSDLEF